MKSTARDPIPKTVHLLKPSVESKQIQFPCTSFMLTEITHEAEFFHQAINGDIAQPQVIYTGSVLKKKKIICRNPLKSSTDALISEMGKSKHLIT